MAEKLGIISSLEPLNKGDKFQEFPLHITLMSWFDMPHQASFVNQLQNFATRYAPQEIIGGDEAMFGEHKDIRVRKLGRAGSLYAMHNELLVMVTKLGGNVADGSHVDRNYVPHITYQDSRGLEEGEAATVDRIQLISGDEQGPRTVLAILGLIKGRQ